MFSTYYPLFFEKMAVSPEKSQNGNIFEIEIFILKYVFNHSETITIKKIWPKTLVFAIFRQKRPNLDVLKSFEQKIQKILYPLLEFSIAVLISHHTHLYL